MSEVKTKLAHPLEEYTRKGMIPHIWCSGCGNGIILGEFIRAIKELREELNYDLDKIVVISGIGCISRIPGYLNLDSYHSTHGRAIAVATGVKLAKPELKPVVIAGDGDLFAIGGNHFIHAARRNIDMMVVCSNNFNYGMTGGQFGPTTPLLSRTTTTPYGNPEHPFNLAYLAAAAGAVYVARWTAIHVKWIKDSFKKAILKKGFSFIEIISPCPEYYGRRNKMRDPMDWMRWFREKSIIMNGIDPAEAELSLNKIVVGEFIDYEKPEYAETVYQLSKKIRERLDREGKRTGVRL